MAKNEKNLYVVLGFKDAGFNKALKKQRQNLQSFAKQITAMGAAITAALGFSVKAAAEEEANIQKLSKAMENVGISYDNARESLEAWFLANQNATSYADTQQREALATLVTMTGDLAQSQDLLTLAMDMAAGTGKDLTSVTSTLGYALAGNWGMVNRMIPALSQVETEEEKWAMLRQMFAGQAEAYGNTLQGQMTALKNAAGDMAEMVGNVLIPIMTDIIDKVKPIIDNIQVLINKNPKLVDTIVKITAAIGVLLTVGGLVLLLIPKIRKAWIALNVTFTTTSIGWILVGITALIAAGIALANNWEQVSKFLGDVWDNIKITFANAIKWIIDGVLGPFFDYQIRTIQTTLRAFASVASIFSPALAQRINNVSEQVGRTKDNVRDWADNLIESAEESKQVRQEQYDLAQATNATANAFQYYEDAALDANDMAQDSIGETKDELLGTLDLLNSLTRYGGTSSGGGGTRMYNKDYWAERFKNTEDVATRRSIVWNMTSADWERAGLSSDTGMTRDEAMSYYDKTPELASGGIAISDTIARIAEGNKPEAIIPLDRLDSIMSNLSVNNESQVQVTTPIYIDGQLVYTSVSKAAGRAISTRNQLGGY